MKKACYLLLFLILGCTNLTYSQFTQGTNSNQSYTNDDVGIGTNNPTYKLDVRGDLGIGETNNAGKILFRRGTDGHASGIIGFNSSTDQEHFIFKNTSGGGYFTFWTNSGTGGTQERMRLATNGKLGVGTSSPQYGNIEVFGTGYDNGITIWNGSASGSKTGRIWFDDANDLFHITRGNDKLNGLTIVRDGNVGVGTTLPGKELDVNGDIRIRGNNATLNFYRTSSPTDIARIHYDQTNQEFNISAGGKTIRFNNKSGQTETMRITNLGDVAIGTTTTSGYKLSVNGKIRAEEVKVYTGWADFVFEDDYDLKSLEEVEKYIKENKHLPDIPSAKEVEENGVNVGEMESKLLQKIEELTLYIIEQEKRIKQLELQIKE
ncbi:hypothetical protein QQ008_00980 [Fulvivirgaceae bacterium BMA10]|uniref:Uncharacterized protein n=1 Tax=Splendidivirga corallicola TaxID=3051826 RepID=A0ABT8KHJ0_9BACT|nr:hypothetical protein [Fulvivirgaceae bacterium BMA10]